MNAGWLPPEQYAFIVRHTPLTSIDLVVRNPAGDMLAGLRRNRPARGCWFMPGGRFGRNETFAAAFASITHADVHAYTRANCAGESRG